MQPSIGQISTHFGASNAPTHSVQRPASITNVGSPALIAVFGHSGSHEPQLIPVSYTHLTLPTNREV